MFTDECITKIANYRFALSIAIEIVGEKNSNQQDAIQRLKIKFGVFMLAFWPPAIAKYHALLFVGEET